MPPRLTKPRLALTFCNRSTSAATRDFHARWTNQAQRVAVGDVCRKYRAGQAEATRYTCLCSASRRIGAYRADCTTCIGIGRVGNTITRQATTFSSRCCTSRGSHPCWALLSNSPALTDIAAASSTASAKGTGQAGIPVEAWGVGAGRTLCAESTQGICSSTYAPCQEYSARAHH
jgi:hypothetical protein